MITAIDKTVIPPADDNLMRHFLFNVAYSMANR